MIDNMDDQEKAALSTEDNSATVSPNRVEEASQSDQLGVASESAEPLVDAQPTPDIDSFIPELSLNDSDECPFLDATLPPPPERSPPPLLPNVDEDFDDVESVDSLLRIKKAEFVLEPPFSSLLIPSSSSNAKPDYCNDQVNASLSLLGVYSTPENGGPVGQMCFDESSLNGTGSRLTSTTLIEHERCSTNDELALVGPVDDAVAATNELTDFGARWSEENAARTFENSTDIANNALDEQDFIGTNNTSNEKLNPNSTSTDVVRLEEEEECVPKTPAPDWSPISIASTTKRPFDMRSIYAAPTSPYSCTSAYSPSTTNSTAGANLFTRVRYASANSGCGGMALLRHLGGGQYQQHGENNQPPTERELSLAQNSSSSASATAYDGHMNKDKTQRWSFAGTAPEVALLRLKLENVERELKDLRGKHEATMNDYQAVLHQLELCRAAKCRQDVDLSNVTSELNHLKSEYDQSCQQREMLQRQLGEWQFQVQSKQVEMEELRQQARDLSRQPSELASKLMEEYEELRMEREKLREQCRCLDIGNAELRAALHSNQNEICQIRARYERELDELRMKNNSLESRQMAAYQQLHRMVQERDLLRSEREMLQQQLDDACADRTRLINVRQKLEGDYQQLRQQHESAVTEYHRVMSERDSILKENERHSEEKLQLTKSLKRLEAEHHVTLDQLKNMDLQLTHFQQQQQHQQHQKFESSREDLMSFRSTNGSSQSIQQTPVPAVRRMLPPIPITANVGSDPHYHHPYVEQRSIASSESEVALITGRAQEEEFDEMRRQMDSIKDQLDSTRQQLEEAKKSRDWALGERQRIVAERDSMRAMCDTLRRERDDAITRLASAIRDTDELQRQKQLAERECRKLKERMDMESKQRASQSGGNQLNACSPSNSRDSAIDTDMAEWEIETLELSVDSAQKSNELGIELGGGRDDPAFSGTVPIYVKSLASNSKFENSLRPYDCIVQVNNIDVTNMERRSVLDILRNSTAVKMVIRRRRLVGMKLISVPLNASNDGDMGVIFENGVYVSRIKTSSSAAKAGNLAVGDRLVYVNDIPVHGKSASDVHELMQSYKGCLVVLAVMKSPPVMSPTTSWPGGFTNSSNNNGTPYGISSRHHGKTGVSGIGGAIISSPTSHSAPAHRDESVQTLASSSEQLLADQNLSSSGSCLALPKKQESLLDKVHDKFFRKAEKKPTVKALATIAVEPSMSCAPKTSVRFDRTRYSRAGSICSATSNASGRSGSGASPEQQVLQQLDRILEDSEREPPVNKSLANVTNSEQSSGGTWPKFRGLPPSTAVGSGVSTVSQQQSKKRTTSRKPVFNVFQQPDASIVSQSQQQLLQDGTSSVYASPLITSPPPLAHHVVAVRPRPANNNTQRRRQHDARPLSYHPAGPIYSNSSNSPVGLSPLSSSSTAAIPMSTRHIVDPLSGSSVYNHKNQQPPPFPHHSRPPSSQSNRRTKAVSQYEPMYDDLAFPRGTPMPATMVKQHHPTHLAFVTPVRQPASSPRQHQMDFVGVSSSPWSPRSPTSLYPSGHQFDSTNDGSSVNSLNSPTPGYSSMATRPNYGRKGYDTASLKSPSQGDVRTIHIEKQFPNEGLGIGIISHGNGVFISAVEKDSLADRHGLQVGDQLLDVCGINMRSVNLQVATNVLSQVVRTDQITLTVQYNQNRYLRAASDYHHQQSAASTPRATPNSLTGSYMKSSIPSRDCGQMQQSRETLGTEEVYNAVWNEPRFVFIKRDSSIWPFTLMGGNATGIFIDTVKEGGVSPGSLRCGDQVLEFDGVDFRKLTMEQALFELQQRPMGAEISMLVQYNEAKYQRSKRGAGDLFYVRVTVDRQAENRDELSFKAGDILRVDNTVFNGVSGLWRAWAVDQEGRELFCGIIPSRARLEDEFIFRRSGSEISGGDGSSEGGGSRRGTIRRSLKFIRRSSRSTHQRAPSKDSRELTDTAEAVIADELYQRVERLDYKQKRPVLVVGPLLDILVAKLMEDYPKMFAHCAPECVQPASISILNQGLQHNIYIDYQKRDKLFEITRVSALKELMDKGFHCILRVSLNAVERLHRLQIYPVVIFVKFKDYKQIKELSEGQVNSKEAKDMFQQSTALEADYHQLITAVINAQHCNIKYICQRIADAVEHEQKKTLWILSSETL